MEIKGTVKAINEAVTKGTFTSQKIWLNTEVGTQYPQVIEVETAQAKVALFANVKIGDEVVCHINLRGREWTNDGKTKVFNTLSVWKVDVVGSRPAAYQQPATSNAVSGPATQFEEDDSSLPF